MTRRESEKSKKIDKKINDERLSPRQRERARKRKKEMQRKFFIRRICCLLVLVLLIVRIVKAASNKSKKKVSEDYPSFRQEVKDDLESEVYVADTSNRILKEDEKLADFDQIFEEVSKNYAIRSGNRKAYSDFIDRKEEFRKLVKDSKTDQEFFQAINDYLALLSNPRTTILSKARYDDYFAYYKEDSKSPSGKIIQNQQAINRYKRMISTIPETAQMEVEVKNNHILRLGLPDFSVKNIDKDLDLLKKTVQENAQVDTILVDLRDNNSANDIYRQKLAPLLVSQDASFSRMVFYRGDLFENNLSYLKDDENSYETSFAKNPAGKYGENISALDLKDYLYYDEVKVQVKKSQDALNKKVYVLTNEGTENEALTLAKILENGGAYLVMDTANVQKSLQLVDFKPDLVLLRHSGLVVLLDDSATINYDGKAAIKYDKIINAKYPLETMLSLIG